VRGRRIGDESMESLMLQELFLNPAKFGLRSRRLDWLVPRILGPVCTYYLRIQHEEEAGHGYNKAAEDRMRQTVANAFKEVFTLEIPEQVGESVTIRSSSGEVYHVMGPGTAEAACECIYFMRGNICKHIVKVSILHGQTVYKVPFDVSSTARIQPPIRVLPGELTN
jgi:hypothetical protein